MRGGPLASPTRRPCTAPPRPRHLAFSCYGFDSAGRVLVTRRAAEKRAFPLVWTGTCCGHPGPDEAIDDAVHRRLCDDSVSPPATSRSSCPTSPTAPRTARSRRTSCARSTSAASTATRPRCRPRWRNGSGGTGRRSSRPRPPRTASSRPGPGCRPRCSTRCWTTPCPASPASAPSTPPPTPPASCPSAPRVTRTASCPFAHGALCISHGELCTCTRSAISHDPPPRHAPQTS